MTVTIEYLVRGDTTPVVFTITDAATGNPADLTAGAVTFTLRNLRANVVDVDAAPCVITDAAAGVCEWRRAADQPSAAGEYAGELAVTFGDATVKHYPDAAHTWQFIARNPLT